MTCIMQAYTCYLQVIFEKSNEVNVPLSVIQNDTVIPVVVKFKGHGGEKSFVTRCALVSSRVVSDYRLQLGNSSTVFVYGLLPTGKLTLSLRE